MKDLEFHLSVQEINTVIKALGQLPYVQVNELIAKIHQQASAQINAGANGNGVTSNGKTQNTAHAD